MTQTTITIKCAVCGDKVEAKRYWVRYCSKACRMIAYGQRLKATKGKTK